jgi:hypothetical protein
MARETVRDRLSATANREHAACQGCAISDRLAESIDAEIVAAKEHRAVTAERISRVELENAAIVERLSAIGDRIDDAVGSLRHETRTALEVIRYSRAGVDVRASTPPGKAPELKAGPVSLRAPGWILIVALGVVAVAGSCSASAAYVAVKVWPAAHR